MEQVTEKAYAKINLGLDVLRKREDGYHEVRMVMQSIGLCDELHIQKAEQGILIKTDAQEIPTGEGNLIYKAARLLMEEYPIYGGVVVQLKKRIPVAAGLAGGSTDAAAAIRGMNRLFELGMDTQAMCRLGAKIGADVPYCILGGTALAEGVGEQLTPLPDAPGAIVLLAKPDFGVSTAEVYGKLQADRLKVHPDIDGMTRAVLKNDLSGITERMGNVLETVTIPAYPKIEQIKTFMKEHGATEALMSGSGPTVFGIYTDQKKAAAAYLEMKKTDLAGKLVLTTFVAGGKEPDAG